MNSLFQKVSTIFIPVSNIEKARDWYCNLLEIPADGEIHFGHIYTVPLDGMNLVLDSKIYSEETVYKVPGFHIDTPDIQKAYEYMKGKGVRLVTGIMHEHWFNIKDPDGNHIMICKC